MRNTPGTEKNQRRHLLTCDAATPASVVYDARKCEAVPTLFPKEVAAAPFSERGAMPAATGATFVSVSWPRKIRRWPLSIGKSRLRRFFRPTLSLSAAKGATFAACA
jgi:hypothetical protein